MKKILFLLLISVAANAQTIDFPDPALKAKLVTSSILNGTATNFDDESFALDGDGDGEIQVDEALLVKTLILSDSGIFSLEGIVNFSNLENLYVESNNLTVLNLDGMTSLTEVDCSTNSLTTTSLNGLTNLSYFNCSDNQLTQLDLTGLDALATLNCGGNQISELSFLELPNLSAVYCYSNLLTSLDFSTNPVFSNLSCSSNNLQFINLKNGFLSTNPNTNWNENPNLAFVCADEEEIFLVQSIINVSGLDGVPVNSYCSFAPGGNYNTIAGTVSFDSNGNGCDASDVVGDHIRINITDGSNNGALYTDNGNYATFVNAGTYTLTPSLENPSWFTSNPTFANIIFPLNNNSASQQNFCLTANGVHSDIEAIVIPVQRFQPGFATGFKIVYHNKGNQTLTGNVSFAYDEPHLNFTSATPAPSVQAPGLLTFNYANLLPFENRSIEVSMALNAPTDTPPVAIGDTFNFTVTANPIGGDEIPEDNTFTINRVATNSYDPNIKTCLEGEVVPPSLIGKYLHYNINFENIGDETAVNVVLKDSIDSSKFDLQTLQVIESSHQVDVRVRGTYIEFLFKNINLPSAVSNPIGGHGNVLFKIKTLPTLQEGDVVTNTANIYFDYNHPIETNEARTTFGTLKRQDFTTDHSIHIFPNPVKNTVHIKANSNLKSLQLFDVLGRILQVTGEHTTATSLDISDKPKGIYFLKITTANGSKVEKLVKE